MIQPRPTWASGEPPAAASDGSGGVSGGRQRHVLLRIPDCSERMRSQQAGERSTVFAAAHWSTICRELAQDLIRPWRRPRALLAGAIGLILILVAVALVAGARQPRPSHAGSQRRDREVGAPPATSTHETCYIGPRPIGPCSQTPGAPDDAPAFPGGELNRAIPNQSAVAHPFFGPTPTGGASRENTAARRPPGPAHLEQRLERIGGTY
jgi:hypothetical protein